MRKFTVKPKHTILASTNQDVARQVYEALKNTKADNWPLEIDTPELFAYYDDSGEGLAVVRFKDVAKIIKDNPDEADTFLEDPYMLYEFDDRNKLHTRLSSSRAVQLFNKLGLEVPDYVYEDDGDEFDW